MRVRAFTLSFGVSLILCTGFSSARGVPARPDFTVTATNTTVDASGSGTSNFTLTSINGYAGTVWITCNPTNPPMNAKLPYCGGGAVLTEKLTASETVTGVVGMHGTPVPAPVSVPHRQGHAPAGGLALAGALLLGWGLRRRASRWLVVGLLAVGALAGLAGISACMGYGSGFTPGTFPYTITGTDTTTNASVSSTFMVTVP